MGTNRRPGAGSLGMTRRFLSAAALIALSPLAAIPGDWPQFGLDPGRSRATTEISGTTFGAGSWTYQVPSGARVVSAPAVADGVVVAAADDGTVVALREGDGALLWQFMADGGVVSSPAIGRGNAYVASLGGQLFARRLSDGAPVWQQNLSGQLYSSPALAGNVLFLGVGFFQKKVVAVDADAGTILWQTAPGAICDPINSSAAIHGNEVLIGSLAGRLYSLDLATGAVLWTFDAGGMVNFSSPLVADGRAYILSGWSGAQLNAIDLATHAVPAGWPMAVADPEAPPAGAIVYCHGAFSSPVLADGRVAFQVRFDYYVDEQGDGFIESYHLREYVAAADPAVPSVTWMAANGAKVTDNPNEIPEYALCPSPAVYKTSTGTALAVSSSLDARLRVLDAATGAEGWSAPLAAPGRSSPVLANGRLIAGTDAGTVQAFRSDATPGDGTGGGYAALLSASGGGGTCFVRGAAEGPARAGVLLAIGILAAALFAAARRHDGAQRPGWSLPLLFPRRPSRHATQPALGGRAFPGARLLEPVVLDLSEEGKRP